MVDKLEEEARQWSGRGWGEGQTFTLAGCVSLISGGPQCCLSGPGPGWQEGPVRGCLASDRLEGGRGGGAGTGGRRSRGPGQLWVLGSSAPRPPLSRVSCPPGGRAAGLKGASGLRWRGCGPPLLASLPGGAAAGAPSLAARSARAAAAAAACSCCLLAPAERARGARERGRERERGRREARGREGEKERERESRSVRAHVSTQPPLALCPQSFPREHKFTPAFPNYVNLWGRGWGR